MRFFHKRLISLVTCVMILFAIAFTGCRSGIFKKPDISWKKPDMSGLAFWKKGDSDTVPPPPAHHFNPAPASDTTAKSEPAESDIQDAFNQLVESAKKQKLEQQNETSNHSAGNLIRSPYTVTPENQSKELTDNSFDPGSGSTKSELPNFNPSVAQAQQDFNAALAGSKQAIRESVSVGSAAANEFAANLQNDFQLPAATNNAQTKISQTQNNVSLAKAKINHSLYDAAGKLTNGGQPQANPSWNNSFDPHLEAVKANTKVLIDDSIAQVNHTAQQAADQIQNSGKDELEKVQSQIALAQQQIAALKQQVAQAKQQAAQSASSTTNQALNMASQTITQPLDRVARLNFPTPNTSATTQNNFQPRPMAPQNGNFSPLDNNSFNSNRDLPNNQLRPLAPVAPINNDQPAAGQPASRYPSTPHDSYAPQASLDNSSNRFSVQPATLLAPASTSSNDFDGGTNSFNSSQTIRAEAAIATEANVQSHVSTANHVSEIDIPLTVLRGSGSYAPGSVNRLAPAK